MKIAPLRLCFFAGLFFIASSLNSSGAPDSSPRERLLMDFGWKFHLGNEWGIGQNLAKAGTGNGPASMWFSDASWRTVNLPHDWAVELPFDQTADAAHGFKALGHGFPSNSVAWYRRTFELPKTDEGKRLWLEFDGAFRDCEVFVNGWHVGHNESGYGSFCYDITDVADCGGKNLVAVKVNASEFEGWFYEGAGLYRHVWLVKTAPVAIAPDGIFIYTKFNNNIPEGPASIYVETLLKNYQTNSTDRIAITQDLFGPDGKKITQAISRPKFNPEKLGRIGMSPYSLETMDAGAKENIKTLFVLQPGIIAQPGKPPLRIDLNQNALPKPETGIIPQITMLMGGIELWSPESPKLYKLVTTVESDGKIVDRQETEFGIRTVEFDKDKGFLLNGKPYVLKGTCNHQDMAGVGAALPDRLQYFRIAKLKEMGDNAIRTSHNPPTPELLDACDHLGMLVMDENRLLGSDAGNLARLKGLILRDRNHPSVGIWSIANEEFTVQDTPAGKRAAETMQTLIQRIDPTRPITYAAPVGDDYEQNINSVIEVRGWNYHVGQDMDNYHREHPNQPNVGSEQGSTVSTRGIYTNDTTRGYVSSYDLNAQPWSSTAESWWSYFAERPWLSGGFIWTGFDYRGEPTPYGWPCINSHFGIMDMCGFPKDLFYYYQSWWTDKPMLHLLPHWNWPGKEGQNIDVWCFGNCREVELFLNGKSLGRKTMKQNSHLEWTVKYEPGILSAKGYKNGQLMAETKVETTGTPAAIQLTPDRSTINADGEDVSVFTVAVADAQGRVVPVATNLIHFELSGPGKILGVGNGDPSCHEPDAYLPVWPGYSVAANDGWRWEKISDPWKPNLPETAASFDDSTWAQANVESLSGPLGNREHAVFRVHINVTEKELAAEVVELCFGSINGDGIIYVNGEKISESHQGEMVVPVDVRRQLHPGDNTVAVVVANYGESGGLNQGVCLRMQEKPILPEWKRSVFNGLAQIIVQSTKVPGKIKLTASAKGLSPAIITIQSKPGTPRPCVP